MAVGMRLRELRKQAGLTQVELAAELGLTGATISGYETEEHHIIADELPKFAEVLRCSPCDFFEAHPKPHQMTAQERVDAAERQATAMLRNDLAGVLDEFVRLADEVRRLQGRSA